MTDLFDREQAILDAALSHLETLGDDPHCDRVVYAALVTEYRRLLKLVKRMTRVSDKTAIELNADKIKLMDAMRYDALTGIHSRGYFDEEYVSQIQSCQASRESLGLLMLDVDFFKRFNDTYGHGAGDECLRRVARTLDGCLSESLGFAARYGGEEFVAVLPGADADEVAQTAADILRAVEALRIPHAGNDGRPWVTLSIGGTWVDRPREADKDAYLNRADEALYASKQAGRARFTLQHDKEDMQ